jgi:hypothetical protein
MADTEQSRSTSYTDASTTNSAYRPARRTAWTGWVVFAGVMLMLVGVFQLIDGLVALFDDGYYVVRPDGLVVNVDYTAWGWLHLVIGIVALGAGFGLLAGRMWARIVAIGVAGLSAIVNFAFIGAYPVWSVILITIDVLVIYAVAAHGRELAD